MRGKLSELRTQQSLEFTLNNNVKVIKEVHFYSPSADGTVNHPGHLKKLIIVQVIGNNECYVIDEAKLEETAVQYLRSYIPPNTLDEDTGLELGAKHIKQMQKLEQ